MEPILYSMCFYVIVLILCEISRQVADQLTGPGSKSRLFLYELIGVCQVITCVYENGVVIKNYGVPGFFMTCLIMIYIHILVNRGATVNPLVSVESLLFGDISMLRFVILTLAQLLGGLIAYRFALSVWWLGLTPDHSVNYTQFTCAINYKIPYVLVALYEIVGCFTIRYVVGWVRADYRKYAAVSTTATLLSFALYAIGVPSLNPIIALGRLYGCRGLGIEWFFVTYWLFDAIGWMAAAYMVRRAGTVKTKTN